MVRPSIKIFLVLESCPHLFVILAEEAILICFMASLFITLKFEKFSLVFSTLSTLLFFPMKAPSHLTSSSRRYFGTRSLNRENSEAAFVSDVKFNRVGVPHNSFLAAAFKKVFFVSSHVSCRIFYVKSTFKNKPRCLS